MREKFKQVFKMERDGLTEREMGGGGGGGGGQRKNLQPDTFDVIRSKSHITTPERLFVKGLDGCVCVRLSAGFTLHH